MDGNGRTSRATEALLLQRAGLRDAAFIAMSNYYYEEKTGYLNALAQARAQGYDLTPFLSFGLRGIAVQCGRLFQEITHYLRKVVFRTMMYDLFPRLRTPRKRVIAQRQIEILKLLLEVERIGLAELMRKTEEIYSKLKNPSRALFRDLNALVHLQAIRAQENANEPGRYRFEINLDWPAQMNESDFLEKVRQLPKAKSHSFL